MGRLCPPGAARQLSACGGEGPGQGGTWGTEVHGPRAEARVMRDEEKINEKYVTKYEAWKRSILLRFIAILSPLPIS